MLISFNNLFHFETVLKSVLKLKPKITEKKSMKTVVALAMVAIFLQGCSNPFGPNSIIEKISDQVGFIFGKTSSNLVSGGTQKFETAGAYKGSISVGNYINQNQTVTNGGYKVVTSIRDSH